MKHAENHRIIGKWIFHFAYLNKFWGPYIWFNPIEDQIKYKDPRDERKLYLMLEAFPAVTVPPVSLKLGRRFLNFAASNWPEKGVFSSLLRRASMHTVSQLR